MLMLSIRRFVKIVHPLLCLVYLAYETILLFAIVKFFTHYVLSGLELQVAAGRDNRRGRTDDDTDDKLQA